MAEFKEDSKFADISFGSEEEEEIICQEGGTPEDAEFDRIVGAIEDILLDDEFSAEQNGFVARHCDIFDNTEENKMEYTTLFNQYTALVEGMLNRKLSEKIPGFRMEAFEQMLISRQDEIGGEIFDLLLAMSDFSEFKEMMIARKQAKEEQKDGDCLQNLAISGSHIN